jgi:putative transcriptional regulator
MEFDLTGKMLISTPAMGDPRFERSLIYLCAHSAEGAFGLVVNRPVPNLRVSEVLEQLVDHRRWAGPRIAACCWAVRSSPRAASCCTAPTWPGGGPRSRCPGGWRCRPRPRCWRRSARAGPSAWHLALGYAGWGAGQLESELAQNAWLTAGSDALIFVPPRARRSGTPPCAPWGSMRSLSGRRAGPRQLSGRRAFRQVFGDLAQVVQQVQQQLHPLLAEGLIDLAPGALGLDHQRLEQRLPGRGQRDHVPARVRAVHRRDQPPLGQRPQDAGQRRRQDHAALAQRPASSGSPSARARSTRHCGSVRSWISAKTVSERS